MKAKKVSIVIPVFNEASTVSRIISEVLKSDVLGLKKEIIVVNDGSTDGTSKILSKIKSPQLKIITSRRNKGKGYALRTGFKHSTGDIIIVQDADLEYSPKEFPKLLKPIINNKSKVVYGSRELSGKNIHSSLIFHAGGKLVTFITNILYKSNLTDEATGYKVFDAKLLKKIKLKCVRFEFCPEVTAYILKSNEKIVEVPIKYNARHRHEGKKIKVRDGIEAIFTLVRIKFNL